MWKPVGFLGGALCVLAACENAQRPTASGGDGVTLVTRTSIGPDEVNPAVSACMFDFALRYRPDIAPHSRTIFIQAEVPFTPFEVAAEVPDADGLGVTENADGTVTATIFGRSHAPCEKGDPRPFVYEIDPGTCTSGACPPLRVAEATGPVPTVIEVAR